MELTVFHYFLGFFALIMLVYNTVEVGRNDAANIVNAVFGAKVLDARRAVFLAGIAVILGAIAASPVMETARKGIFDPSSLGPTISHQRLFGSLCHQHCPPFFLLRLWDACIDHSMLGVRPLGGWVRCRR